MIGLFDDETNCGGDYLIGAPAPGCLYRYENWGTPDHTPISLRSYPITSKTPCGAWIDAGGVKKFVLDGKGKRFAYPTVELARESFLIRKRRQIQHLANQHDAAVEALAAAERLFAARPPESAPGL